MAARPVMPTKPKRPPRPPSGRTNLASCVVATIFLLFIIIVIAIVYFMVFKPQDPKIAVNSVRLPSFSVVNGTVNFTFSQYASISNPNRAAFSHYDSTLQLIYSGNQVGFMFIPAGEIDARRTEFMAATFSVQSFPLSPPVINVGPTLENGGGVGFDIGMRVQPTMEIESKLQMAGRVRVLHFFSHRVKANAGCRVAIAVTDGSVLGLVFSLTSIGNQVCARGTRSSACKILQESQYVCELVTHKIDEIDVQYDYAA
ncbi:hypothetical protein RIF29_34629 [Crotalaria pallida]|uniref:Late embryogenesis abundant protein LEA-2 subgroup domain-containing protein n=1 Tax=Crotalaria pallida TaxID=3830 RepID=A0AAN9HTF5_CROPI